MNFARLLFAFCRNPERGICAVLGRLVCLLGVLLVTFASQAGQQREPLKLEQLNTLVRDQSTSLEEMLEVARDLGIGFDVDRQVEELIAQSRGGGQKSRTFLAELKLLRRRTVRLASMARIPKGKLQMGSEEQKDEMPVHQVDVQSFYLDKHEVTNSEYAKFREYIASCRDHSKCHPTEPRDKDHTPEFLKDISFNGTDQPVVGVDWYDAYAYAAWAGVRLPTEIEWEWAARGGLVGQRFPWGDEAADGKACYGGLSSGTKSVGRFPPNGFGLADMAGNAWEWVNEWYTPGYQQPEAKASPEKPVQMTRVVRGGSWASPEDNLRCAFRGNFSPAFRRNSIGFRCAANR